MRRVVLGLMIAALSTAALAEPSAADIASQFKIGVATPADVIAKLGAPMSEVKNSDGTEMLTYVSSSGHVKAATFVPIVGLFAGGTVSRSSSLVFTFDANGLLKSTGTSNTRMDCSTMILGANCHSN